MIFHSTDCDGAQYYIRYTCSVMLNPFAETPVQLGFYYYADFRDQSVYQVIEGNYTEYAAATMCTTMLGDNATLARYVGLLIQ